MLIILKMAVVITKRNLYARAFFSAQVLGHNDRGLMKVVLSYSFAKVSRFIVNMPKV